MYWTLGERCFKGTVNATFVFLSFNERYMCFRRLHDPVSTSPLTTRASSLTVHRIVYTLHAQSKDPCSVYTEVYDLEIQQLVKNIYQYLCKGQVLLP